MNILVLDSWLRDFLKTEASAREIGQFLSLCGPSVERVKNLGKDWALDIEITANRPDTGSVMGIAREAAAILPRFGKKAVLSLPKIKVPLPPQKSLPLKIKIQPTSICPRFSAIILDDVCIKPSPLKIQRRLEGSGIRAINNIVDISNYLMLESGQPIHIFDYDLISKKTMIMRLSRKGERITTLDGVTRTLSGDDIAIEDGEGKLVDLCGIMGGENSAISKETKRVLLFVQSYDPVRIRRTSMNLALRTEAAIRFERGVDEEGIEKVIWQGVKMAKSLAKARLASKFYDIYPQKFQSRIVTVSLDYINQLLGVRVSHRQVKDILKSLGFKVEGKNQFKVGVPSWRSDDVFEKEDLAEEVARIYGYHNLPSRLPKTVLPHRPRMAALDWESKIKEALKYWGFTEVYHLSMIGLSQLENIGIEKSGVIQIANPLTSGWVYLRPSLIPQLLETLARNEKDFSKQNLFELANVYFPQERNLPQEKLQLTAAFLGGSFFKAKGIALAIVKELGILDYSFEPAKQDELLSIFLPYASGQILVKGNRVGVVGKINSATKDKFGLKNEVYLIDLKIGELFSLASGAKKYLPLDQYPPLIEDLAFVFPTKIYLGPVIQLVKSISSLVRSVTLADSYKNTRTLRIVYQSKSKTLTEKEVRPIREEVIRKVKKNFNIELKTASY